MKMDKYRLREIKEKDFNEIFLIYSKKEICRYFGINVLNNISEAKRMTTFLQKNHKEKNIISFGITQKENDNIIGVCHFQNINSAYKKAEISYEINRTYWNKGVMTQVLPILINYGFKEMKLNRIQAIVCEKNTASIKLLENNKFQKEGLLRENIYNFIDNKFEDTLIYGKINQNN